jgi:RNA polymerase sigma factor
MEQTANALQLTERLALAKDDRAALSRLLIEYMPFIKKCVSSVFFKADMRREHFGAAMLAFIQSVRTYHTENGAFIPYARVVIRNRLLDEARKEQRRLKHEEQLPEDREIAARESYDIAERQAIQSEIAEVSGEFSLWGFDWKVLSKCCPKQKRTRRTCAFIARAILLDSEMAEEVIASRKIPVQRLVLLTGIREKIFEKYRRYIGALVVILQGDYPYLHSFLPHIYDEYEDYGIPGAGI